MGEGKLTGKGKLSVAGADGKATELSAKHIIVATGARARDLPFAKTDGKRIWTYRHAMTPPEMPTELLVIGSGAIGIEFASFYADLGAKVTVVEMLDRVVPVEDAEVSAQLAKSLQKQGLTILTSAGVESLKPDAKGVAAKIKTADGKSSEQRFSHCIVAVGILPSTENIGLEALGVKTTKGHIDTDAMCRTNVPGIWAIGDVTAPPRLACATTNRPSLSTASPSGPLAPKKVRKAPTFEVPPSCSSGPRHTAFARVAATNITLPAASSAMPLGLGTFPSRQSSRPAPCPGLVACVKRYTRPEGSCNPVCPWSVK
jgi:dihydrolipoamide dehydrogenase